MAFCHIDQGGGGSSEIKNQAIERYYIFLGHLFHPILWLAPMSPQQIRCKGKESKNENDISAVCLLRKYFFSQGWFWLMKKTCFTNWTFCLVPQTLRPLGFFANIKNPATSGTKELNRSLFAETEIPPCASSNQKEINHTWVLLAAWQRVWEWSRGGWWARRGRARDRPFDGGHDTGGDGDDGDDDDDDADDDDDDDDDGDDIYIMMKCLSVCL